MVFAQQLRLIKADVQTLIALADLGGVWSAAKVMRALSQTAEVILRAAFEYACLMSMAKRGLPHSGLHDNGIFLLAFGKLGALELNYSSDVDLVIYCDQRSAATTLGTDYRIICAEIANVFTELVGKRTADGFLYRLDYRLRPDPASTPVVVMVDNALLYYESRGQTWERAAFIKARYVAGDKESATRLLTLLSPFTWRRNLDFRALAEIRGIKQQIRLVKEMPLVLDRGLDLKLGSGGIREIEFFVQTQQLILGGRHSSLRIADTAGALVELGRQSFVDSDVCQTLTEYYLRLRTWENRLQMVADEQTHSLPTHDAERRRIAYLSGFKFLGEFDDRVYDTLRYVHARFSELFADDESLATEHGNLIFTGVDDDPATLATLSKMGFAEPVLVSRALRAWRAGGTAATATEAGRAALTRLTPRLLNAAARTGAPDAAFAGFCQFFKRLPAGTQMLALLLARPDNLEHLLRTMAFAPRIARSLARWPTALDVFVARPMPLTALVSRDWAMSADETLEFGMDEARRAQREAALHIAMEVVSGLGGAAAAASFSDLADRIVTYLCGAVSATLSRSVGEYPGSIAVVGLGKAGAREMTATSDLDLIIIYAAERQAAADGGGSTRSDQYPTRFAQRLITALSAPTNEGLLYAVDMRLRPSGAVGPVAASLKNFEWYYSGEAEEWELLALTRARVMWASSAHFAHQVERVIHSRLRHSRPANVLADAVISMRRLVEQQHPARGLWDFKYAPGGFVDIEFACQFLQLGHTASRPPLLRNTGEMLMALQEFDPITAQASASAVARLAAAAGFVATREGRSGRRSAS